MSHDHAHNDRAAPTGRLTIVLGLTLLYMLAEAVGGWLAGSLALLADAGHMLSDAAALGMALFAAWIARRPPTPQHSYGYYRAEILAALANGATLIAIALYVSLEAIERLVDPQEVHGGLMLGIAAGGLLVNLAGVAILFTGRAVNLNVRGAWLHLVTDAAGSVAALAAAGLIAAYGWNWADAVASLAISGLVLYSAWTLVREAVDILMESTPRHIDVDAVRRLLADAPGVVAVHDLHVWAITGGMESLSAHVVIQADQSPRDTMAALRAGLHEWFGIDHITIQIESEDEEHCGTTF